MIIRECNSKNAVRCQKLAAIKQHLLKKQLLGKSIESKQAKANRPRGTNIFINEGFSIEKMELRKQLWKEVIAYCTVAYLSYRTAVVKKGRNFAK